MGTKENIKKQIDTLSEGDAEKVYQYMVNLKGKPTPKKPLPSLDLKGKLDDKNIRSLAYD
ncbi:MAG: hypothetical protein EA364_15010 [Balneolaceae bacterium]|nr:MAG: hypothetical protein EA364_15010 [Balneolaceae bacterium]